MPDLALDFSAQHPPIAELTAHAVKAIMIYSRVSTPERGYLEQAVAAGIGICPVFETAATRSFGGYAAGQSDGNDAAGDLTRIGVPAGVRCYVNMADTPNVGGHETAIAGYARGFAETFPTAWQLGAYGPLDALRAAQRGSPRFDALWGVETWHPNSTGNPATNYAIWAREPAVVLVQMANVAPPIGGTDTNWIITPELGAWGGGEDDMAISDEQMGTLGKWMQDQREVMLNVLIGDHDTAKDKGVLAGWENDTRAHIIAALAKIPVGAITPDAIAEALHDHLGDAIAGKVADALAARLAT